MIEANVEGTFPEVDLLIEEMKAARRSPAVLKMRLVLLRGSLPKTLILAFEGGDDKLVYHHWIGRIKPDLQYEPFPCGGKKLVLQLRDIVLRDTAGIANGVYFFVDRDFDDLAGYAEHPSTFMTDRYSVDNYLVGSDVLEELLKNEFQCHGRPEVREPIRALFEVAYDQFLAVTRDVNRRLFLARRIGLGIGNAPDKLATIATVTLNEVLEGTKTAEQAVVFPMEPAEQDVLAQSALFDALDPRTRYRGKYAREFFEKWLGLLADDYAAPQSHRFPALNRAEKVRRSELGLGGFAAKSPMPVGLSEFLATMVVA